MSFEYNHTLRLKTYTTTLQTIRQHCFINSLKHLIDYLSL